MTEISPRPGPLGANRAAPRITPSPDEALAVYRLTARLVELQLELAEQGGTDPAEWAVTHDVLIGTRQVLLAALQDADDEPVAARTTRKASLQVVPGGADTAPGLRGRRDPLF